MSIQFNRTYGIVLGLTVSLSLTAQPAFADLTAQDVWDTWKEQVAIGDLDVSATESLLGGVLTVTDLQIAGTKGGSGFTVKLPSVTFDERGDGTVSIIFPQAFNIDFESNIEDAGRVTATAASNRSGSKIIASGTPENIALDYGFDTWTISLSQFDIETDKPIPHIDLDLTLADFKGRSNIERGEMRHQSDTMSGASMVYNMAITGDDNDLFSLQGELNDLDYTGTTVSPLNTAFGFENITQLLGAGLKYTSSFTYKEGTTAVDLRADSHAFSAQTTSESGTLTTAFDANGLKYSVQGDDATINLSGDQIPFPIALNMRHMNMNLTAPVSKSDAEQDFALAFGLHDFNVPELLWSLVDPEGGLPHDPATLAFDVSGKLKLFFDLFDETQIAAVEIGNQSPGEINTLDINGLRVSIAGTELTGTGGFTFDNENLETFDGLPAPSGEVNLQLVGANGLITSLADLGLLPDQQALGARMMMGLFTTPGEGEDTLTSRVQVKDNGEIIANGQRLR